MAKRVFLHVGLPKSGTTYLQAVLAENKERLGERSQVLYPGARWYDQVLAARDVLAANPHGVGDPHVDGAWQRLAEEIAAWEGDAVVSMEWLGSAQPDQARRMVGSLVPAQVHVVVTARDLARTIPAAWQEFTRNWETWTWEEFLSSIASENPRATPSANLFWTQQDLGRVLAIWRDVLPPEQVHVVTLPPPGSTAGTLWSRFATVLGVDDSQFDASGRGSNESLGLESAVLMMRINNVSRTRNLSWKVYDELFKSTLAMEGLSKRRHLESTLVVPDSLRDWVQQRTDEHLEAVRASGVQVVGDLADLRPVYGEQGLQPDDVGADGVLDAAVDGMVVLARECGDMLQRVRGRNAEQRAHVRELEGRVAELEEKLARYRGPFAPVIKQAVIDVSERRPLLMRMRRAYWFTVDQLRKLRR